MVLSGVLFQTLNKLIVCINFELNRDFIAKNLCVKKEEPKNCCQGKCHLKKQLDKQDENEKSAPVKSTKEVVETQFYYGQQQVNISYGLFYLQKIHTPYKFPELLLQVSSIFHPPKC